MLSKRLRKLLFSSSGKSTTGRAAANKKPLGFKAQLRLEGLEDRMVLSAPAPFSLGNVSVPATSEGGQVFGTYFLGGSFDTGNQSIGSISSTPVGQFGAELNLNLSGRVGVDLGYSASTGGQVDATYQGISLAQNYSEPTQFSQQVNFTPQNTNVSYQSGCFSTTGPSVSASANLVANVAGSIGGTFAFFKSVSGSSSFSTNLTQPLFNIGIGSTGNSNGNDLGLTLGVLGTDFSNNVNDLVSGASLSASANPAGPEVPIYISGSVNGSSSPIGLHESLSLGVGEGEGDEAIGGSIQLGSADQYIPDISLKSRNLQNNGVLTDSEQGNLADLNIQAGPVVAALLSQAGFPGGAVAALAGSDTLSVGPASVTFTPISFQVGPNLTLAQTSTITPTNQLTYAFTNPAGQTLYVDVTKDGQDLGLVSSVTFSPGVDNLGIKFAGTPITVTPTWNYTESYNEELDLDVSFQGSLTVGSLSAAFGDVSTPTLGPLYSQNFDFADYKIATIYDNTVPIATQTKTLPSFVIGSTFTPSLNVTSCSDSDMSGSGSLRFAVESADNANSSSPQIIHLGPGTYNLTLSPDSNGPGQSGALYVTAQNLIIEGAGLGQTIINASGLGDRAFNVASGANLTLDGVTVAGGSAGQNANGGGIFNSGTLTVSDSAISGNSAFVGGGIENDGQLTIINSLISGNTSSRAGGGIDNFFQGNVGATLTILNSTISGNNAGGFGGGIDNAGTVTIDDSTISDNQAAFEGGGGIYNTQFGTATIDDSTISGNAAIDTGITPQGGGIFNENVLTLINCTIANNTVEGDGGGIATSTVAFRPNMVTTLDNTIVSGNFEFSTIPSDIYGVINGPSSNNLIGGNPLLAPLGDYGGPTETMALLLGSPAIAAGTSTVPGGLPLTDQRGFARTVNGKVDIGAVQYQHDLGLTGYVTPGSAPGTAEYIYVVTNNGPDPVTGATLTVPLAQGTTFLQPLLVASGWMEADPGAGNNGTVIFTDVSNLNAGQNAAFVFTAQLQNTAVGVLLTNTATLSPTTSDAAPQNNAVTLSVVNEQEGQTFKNVLLHFTDPNRNAKAVDFTASIFWGDGSSNSTNDGSGNFSVVADPNGGFDVVGAHAYVEEGDYDITVSVSGLDGTVYTGSAQQLYVVADAPLTAGALTPPPFATINQAIANAFLFYFTDANPIGVATDYTATVTWGDGATNSSKDGSGTVSVVADPNGGFDVLGAHTYTQIVNAGTFSVHVNDAGGSSTGASDGNFQVQAPDQPLTAGALNVPSVTTEGQAISNQVLFHFNDPDADAQASDYLATVFWGDGAANSSNDSSGSVSVVADPNGGFEVLGAHGYFASSGAYFAVKITDLGDPRSGAPDLGGQVTGAVSSTPLTIIDPPVVVTAGQTFTDIVNKPSAVQTVATFTDPGGPDTNAFPVPYIATIQWGDGAVTVASLTAQANYTNATVNSQGRITGQISFATSNGGIVLGSDGQTFSVDLAHEYANQGKYTITILLNHEGVLSPTLTTTALVAGLDNLTAMGGASITSTFGAGISNTTVATFTDTNNVSTASDFTATITWGDGQSSSGTISGGNGNFTVAGSHDYAIVGNFPIGISISNLAETATVAASTSATINPAAPTVTVSDASGTYDGQPFAAIGTALGVNEQTVSGSFSFAYYVGQGTSGTSLGQTAPTHAGIYTVVATFSSNDHNYNNGIPADTSFSIYQAMPTVPTPIVPSNAVYDGQPQGATVGDVTGVSNADLGAPTLTYYAGTYTPSNLPGSGGSALAPTNAGNYTVVAFYADSTDYEAVSNLATYTISPAKISYIIGNDAQIFGYPANLAADLPSSFNTGTYSETLDITYSSSGDTSTAKAGTYAITGAVSNGLGLASNYTVTLTNGSLTVLASGVTVVGTELWIIGGTTSNDNVQVNPAGASATGSTGVQVKATLNGVYASTIYSQAFTTINIVMYAGNDNIQLATTLTINTKVSAGNGNDNVQVDAGNNTVTLGNGNDNVQLGNGTNTVIVGKGNDNIQAGNGNNKTTAGNGNDNVQLGSGSNVVTLGDGNENVNAGTGNNTVTLGNGNDNVSLGNGANTVTVGNGNDNINLGNGNNTVTLGNGNDNTNLGYGNNVVMEGTGHDNLNAGNGNNLIAAGLGQHNVSVGNGTNILIDGSVKLTESGDTLRQVLNDWTQFGALSSNVASIRSRLAVTYNSSHANHMTAGSGLDWFWATYAEDTLNRKAGDLLN
jgi:RTX calcium-binding nonapeptide repeat (4 copies)